MSLKTIRGRNVLAHGRQVPVPIGLNAAAHKGFTVCGTDSKLYVSNGTAWEQIYTFDPDAPPVRSLTSAVEFTVGAGGDFASVGDALEYLSTFLPYANADWATAGGPASASVLILSGHVLDEQVYLNSVNLSWVNIYAEDASVDVEPTGLTRVPLGVGDSHPLFFGDNARMPTVRGILFNLLAGTIPQDALIAGVYGPYTPVAEVYSARTASTGEMAGYFEPDDITYRYCGTGTGTWGYGASVANRSAMRVLGCKFEDCTKVALQSINFADLYVVGTLATRAGTAGLQVANNSNTTIVNGSMPVVPSGTITSLRKVDGVDSTADLQISGGSIVQRVVGTLGGANRTANTLQPEGIYFYDDGVSVVLEGTIKPEPYTVATLPSAAAFDAHLIHVADGDAGDPCLAVSNGTNWLRIALGAAVSAT
jgi:hypothetical protein